MRPLATPALCAVLSVSVWVACTTSYAPPCDPDTCSGCCAQDVCIGAADQRFDRCGVGGASCRACLPGQLCSAGACNPDPNASPFWIPSVADAGPCGASAQPCCASGKVCGAGLSCQSGLCQPQVVDAGPPPPPDAGGRSVTGSACTTDSTCAGLRCIPSSFSYPYWNFGYCSQPCSTVACAQGSACSPAVLEADAGPLCLESCTPDGGRSTCRASYACDRYWVADKNIGSCVSACVSASDCPLPSQQNCQAGICCGTVNYECCSVSVFGQACSQGTCGADGYCH